MQQKYRLLKDLPGVKAGAIFEYNDEDNSYEYEINDINAEGWFEPVWEICGLILSSKHIDKFKKLIGL